MKKKILTLSMLFMSIFAFQSCIWWWGPGRPIGPIGPGGGEGPGGGGGGDIPEEVDPRIDNVVPDDIRDKMEDYMPIYNGTTPPTIDGIYLVSPVKLVCGIGPTRHHVYPRFLRVERVRAKFNHEVHSSHLMTGGAAGHFGVS